MTSTLAEARRKAGFKSRADLAEALGVHLNSVSRWERGEWPAPKWLAEYLAMKEMLSIAKVIIEDRGDDISDDPCIIGPWSSTDDSYGLCKTHELLADKRGRCPIAYWKSLGGYQISRHPDDQRLS